MRSERGTAEQTAPGRHREASGGVEREAGMTNYSSRRSVGDRLPRWVCLTPEPGKMGTNPGKITVGVRMPTGIADIIYYLRLSFMLKMFWFFLKITFGSLPDVSVQWVALEQRYYSGTSVSSRPDGVMLMLQPMWGRHETDVATDASDNPALSGAMNVELERSRLGWSSGGGVSRCSSGSAGSWMIRNEEEL